MRVHDETIFVIAAKRGSLSAGERAKESTSALKEAIKTASADDVRVERRGDVAVVYAGPTPIVTVTAEDAQLAGDATIDDRAAAIASRVGCAAHRAEAQRHRHDRVFHFARRSARAGDAVSRAQGR